MPSGQYRTQMTIWGRSPGDAEVAREFVDGGNGTLPFSENLFPLVRHPLVREAGSEAGKWLLAQRCYAYLDWTFALETDVVLPVAGRLADDIYDLAAGPALSEDAFKIILDEGFHSIEAMHAKLAVAAATGIAPLAGFIQPSFLARLRASEDATDREQRLMARFVFALVSETLITGFLTDLPEDHTVLPVVRATVRRHAIDEASHHRVFAKVMAIAWDRWSLRQRDLYAPWFAEFLDAFLAPDRRASAFWLHRLGLAEAAIHGLLEDVFAPSVQAPLIRRGAEPSLRAMRRAGLFDHPAFVDALGAKGLA